MEFPDKESLKSRYEEYSDDQLLEVLRNRNNYQGDAVGIAMEIAINRKLIHSEQDLLSLEFNAKKSHPFQLFPQLSSEVQTQKVLKSLFRILYLITLFPLIFGVLKYSEGRVIDAIVYGVIGVLWAVLAIGLEQKQNNTRSSILLILFISTIFYAAWSEVQISKFVRIDWVISVVSISLIMYSLLYIHILICRRKSS